LKQAAPVPEGRQLFVLNPSGAGAGAGAGSTVPRRPLVDPLAAAPEAGFRPSRQGPHLSFRFTAAVILEPHGTGTKYTAIAMHGDEESRNKHDAMGFQTGWGAVLEQLVEHMKSVHL
jgi:uncharacterized protein YndB with AHSA1/START domain